MAELFRTQILLTSAQQRYLKGRAEREGRSVSKIMRELVNMEMENRQRAIMDDPFWDIVGMVAGGDAEAGVEHDHFIYGTPRKGKDRT